MTSLHPIDINFFTTYRCNSRCRNCGIWRTDQAPEGGRELDVHRLKTLFQEPLVRQCRGFGFAGGEPTISAFFWKMLEIVPQDKQITITTNGLAAEKLTAFLRDAPDRERYLIQVSLDGIGPLNDRMRGVPGAFEKATNLIRNLTQMGVRRLISFTANPENLAELPAVYRFAEESGALFSARVAYQGGAYANQGEDGAYKLDEAALKRLEAELKHIIKAELEKPDHQPAKLVFFSRMADYHRGRQRDLPCLAMESGMVIDLFGHVYPNCPVLMEPLGNLWHEELSAVWSGPKASAMRERIRRLACGGCWNDCQVVTNIAHQEDFLTREYSRLKITALEGKPVFSALDCNLEHHQLLLRGWHNLEGEPGRHFRWTEPAFSFLMPPGTRGLEFTAMASTGNGAAGNDLTIALENGPLLQMVFPTREWVCLDVMLPEPTRAFSPVSCSLAQSYCPQKAGHGPDARNLGLAVSRIRFLS